MNRRLRQFESRLIGLADSETGYACLANIGQSPILEVDRNGNDVMIRVFATDTFTSGSFSFTIKAYVSQIAEMRDRMRRYPKWW